MTTHDLYSPSRLAFLEYCLDFEGQQESEDADFGTYVHDLIRNHGEGKPIDGKSWDVFMAKRAVEWLHSLGEYTWHFEDRVDGAIKDTGGYIDVWAQHENKLLIVDWKGSLPPVDSAQGKGYALNLWHKMHKQGQKIDSVEVYFFNYQDGQSCCAIYNNMAAVTSDIAAIIRRHGSQMGNRRSANYGCSYCVNRATCKVAMDTTATELSIPEELEMMSPVDILQKYEALKAVMKRADKIQEAMKDKLMEAARTGSLPGYTVKAKKSPKQEWRDEAEAMTTVQAILSSHFADAKVTGLLPVSAVKAAVKEALGKSHTKEVEAALMACVQQGSYETLVKDKE